MLQHPPCQRGDLCRREAGHHRVEIAGGGSGPAGERALIEAIGARGLNHHALRAVAAEVLTEGADHGGCQPADAGLHENMGRGRSRQRRPDLVHQHGVAVHDPARRLVAAGMRGVGDQKPALARGLFGAGFHGFVVASGNAHDVGALRSDGALAARAHRPRQEHRAPGAGASRAPGHGEPVVAVGRATHGHVMDARGGAARGNVRDGDVVAQTLAQQVHHGVGAAECLEAAEAEAPALVLEPQVADAEGAGETRQPMQRGGPVALEARDGGAGCGAALRQDHRAVVVAPRCWRVARVHVEEEGSSHDAALVPGSAQVCEQRHDLVREALQVRRLLAFRREHVDHEMAHAGGVECPDRLHHRFWLPERAVTLGGA